MLIKYLEKIGFLWIFGEIGITLKTIDGIIALLWKLFLLIFGGMSATPLLRS